MYSTLYYHTNGGDVRQFQLTKFKREAEKEGLTESSLRETYEDFLSLDKEGQQKFSLGAGLYKLRVASKSGRGKSGGSRTILAYRKESRLIWLHLFPKNEKENVIKKDLEKLKEMSVFFLNLTENELDHLVKQGGLTEIKESKNA